MSNILSFRCSRGFHVVPLQLISSTNFSSAQDACFALVVDTFAQLLSLIRTATTINPKVAMRMDEAIQTTHLSTQSTFQSWHGTMVQRHHGTLRNLIGVKLGERHGPNEILV